MNILHQVQALVTDRDLFMLLWMKGNTPSLSKQKTQLKKNTKQKSRTLITNH